MINNFLFPEDIRHRCGPWKPWIESILVALLSPQETPRSLEQLVELMRMLEQSDGDMTFDGYPGKVTKLELDPVRREAVLRVTLVNA